MSTTRVLTYDFGSTETSSYLTPDTDKTILGHNIVQEIDAFGRGFCGPIPTSIGRPMVDFPSTASGFPHVVSFSSTVDWVFLIELSTASATRRIKFYQYDRVAALLGEPLSHVGAVTIAFPTNTNHTVRGFKMVLENYTTGTVSVNGTSVTGSGTGWQTDRMSAGCRIGFGSTDPALVDDFSWFIISSIGSDTSITLSSDAGTFPAGTPYVIQDMMAVIATTNATTTNGGLFVAKGMSRVDFGLGTTFSAATTTDNVQATYWLADAGTVTNTVSCGAALEPRTSWTSQNVYIPNGTATTSIFKYNIRASLTSLSSGKSTAALVLISAGQAVTGTTSQTNNGIISSGLTGFTSSTNLYFCTTTRVYRVDVSTITNGGNWISDVMSEQQVGNTSTFALTAAMANLAADDITGRLAIMTSGATAFRSYFTRFITSASPFEHIWLVDTKHQDLIGSVGAPPTASTSSLPMTIWIHNGLAYICRTSTSATFNFLYTIPVSAHWTYANVANKPSGRLKSAKIRVADYEHIEFFNNIYINAARIIGSSTDGGSSINLGYSPEAFRVYIRAGSESEIDNDTATWNLVSSSSQFTHGELYGQPLVGGEYIQVAIEFKIFGLTCIPARIYNVAITYSYTGTESGGEKSYAYV